MRNLYYLVCLCFLPIGLVAQISLWQDRAEKLTDQDFEVAIQASNFKINSNPFLQQIGAWETDETITGAQVYQRIINWKDFPIPSETGILIQQNLELDTSFTVPFYIYIPENYNPDFPNKLLIYYKGGWIQRKNFPGNIAKEMVLDNPTFSYLDEYNVIQVFPALNTELAIYGFYGYQHIREMLVQTKKLLNIDDNQVFLAGFSDGGRTVYNLAFLRPSAYAAFFSINGVFNNYKMNFPNFASRKITTYSGLSDDLIPSVYPFSVAAKANEYGADWALKTYDGPHFYFESEKEILPDLFQQMDQVQRNPFPHQIIYHKSYEFDELNGIDWINIVVNEKKAPATWSHSSETSIQVSKEETKDFIYGPKTAQVEAEYFNNTFRVKTSMIDEVEIYISPLMIDLNRPVKVILDGDLVYESFVDYDKAFMLNNLKTRFDRKQVWINKIKLRAK